MLHLYQLSKSSAVKVILFCVKLWEQKAELLEPTVDTVTYDDGLSEEVYGYDVPVPELEKEFDLALIGTKGKWYDHKVSIANPEKTE